MNIKDKPLDVWTYKKAFDAELKKLQDQATCEYEDLRKTTKIVDKAVIKSHITKLKGQL
jgi:hypothetical protein